MTKNALNEFNNNITEKRILFLNKCNVLNHETEEIFDNINKIASNISGSKIAIISFLGDNEEIFKSGIGTTIKSIPKQNSLSFYDIKNNEVTIISQLSKDNNLKQYIEPHFSKMEFYIAIPIKNNDGLKVGNIIILDDKTKKISKKQIESLKLLSLQITELLNFRIKTTSDQSSESLYLFDLSKIKNKGYLAAFIDNDFNCLNFNNEFMTFISKLNNVDFNTNKNLKHILKGNIYSKWMTYFKKAISGKEFNVVEVLKTTNQTEYYDISFSPVKKNIKIIGFTILGKEINNLKDIENSLLKVRNEKELSDTILISLVQNTEKIAIAIFDKDTKFLLFNDTYKNGYFKKFGFYPEIGSKLEDFNNKANEYIFWRSCYDRVLGGEKFDLIHEYEDNGKICYAELLFFPINNSLNEIIGFYLFLFDINLTHNRGEINHKNYLIY